MNIHSPHVHGPKCNCDYCFFDIDRAFRTGPLRVVVESPYAGMAPGETAANVEYARRCVAHALSLGEAPIASHLLHTQPGILNDDIPGERTKGIEAGLAWHRVAELVVFYIDRGMSPGMAMAFDRAKSLGVKTEFRKIERVTR